MAKTAIVTGSSRGIGRAIAEKFAASDYNIVLCYNKSKDEAKRLASKLSKGAGMVYVIKVDVSKKEDIDRLYDETIKLFGRIDVVVNNAGIDKQGLLIDENYESISSVIGTNLTSVIYSCKRAAEHMMKFDGGKIVNISSIQAKLGSCNETVYAATKSALTSFTLGLSKEVGSCGILVNNVAPGVIDTDMMKGFLKDKKASNAFFDELAIKRVGKPEEVANLVYFLCSDENTYITGQTIYIDGGM